MRVVITGATGTIGRAVAGALQARGDEVVALSRDARRGAEKLGAGIDVREWPDPTRDAPADALAGADAVVNLLGEPLEQRWTAERKLRMRDSRVLGTRALVDALKALPQELRPQTLVSQSAVGYYGPTGEQPLDEDAPAGDDFLAELVKEWEAEAEAAAEIMRVVRTRTGVVLAAQGGALAKMLPFFRFGIGGPVAGGRQYVSWIHLDDAAAAILRCLDDAELEGAVNVTSPEPVTNAELSRALGRVLHRPAVLPVPGFAVRIMYGEMAQIVTTGQRVVPAKLQRAGFEYRHPRIDAALSAALGAG